MRSNVTDVARRSTRSAVRASTTASVVAASLGYTELDQIGAPEIERIKTAHLLLCMYNAWQPGVFALSGWDLVGALPLQRSQVQSLIDAGDTRWIERGMGKCLRDGRTLRRATKP